MAAKKPPAKPAPKMAPPPSTPPGQGGTPPGQTPPAPPQPQFAFKLWFMSYRQIIDNASNTVVTDQIYTYVHPFYQVSQMQAAGQTVTLISWKILTPEDINMFLYLNMTPTPPPGMPPSGQGWQADAQAAQNAIAKAPPPKHV